MGAWGLIHFVSFCPSQHNSLYSAYVATGSLPLGSRHQEEEAPGGRGRFLAAPFWRGSSPTATLGHQTGHNGIPIKRRAVPPLHGPSTHSI